MSGRTIVVTGASDGIGAAAARALAADGHTVVVVGRSPERTRQVAAEVGGPAHVADFARLDEVRGLAADLLAVYERIDVLVNNAGGVFGERTVTPDGLEATFQVDHLAHFLLTNLLMDRLLASRATVLATSSVASRASRMTVEDARRAGEPAPEGRYSSLRAYADAKLANVLHVRELDRRYGDAGLATAAVHPGGVATSFAATSADLSGWFYRSRLGRRLMRTPEQGAATLVRLARTTPGVDWPTGGYWSDDRPARGNPRAHDPALARALWERSEQLVAASVTG